MMSSTHCHVAVDVELEDLRRRGGGGRLLERRQGHRADGVHDAELGGRPGRAGGAVGIEGLQRADRRQNGRDAQLLAEEGGRRIDGRDVDQDARPERDLVEGEPVPPQRRLRLRAADQVVPGALIQLPTRLLDDLLVADHVPHLTFSTQEWGVAL